MGLALRAGWDRPGTVLGIAAGVLALAILTVLPLPIAAALIAGGVGLLAALMRPELLLVTLAFAIPFGSLRTVAVGGVTVSAADALVALLIVGWAGRMVMRQRLDLRLTAAGVPALMYVAFLAYSATTASSVVASLTEVAKWAQFAIVLVFVATEVRGRWRWVVLGALLTAGAVEALVGWYQFLLGVGPPAFIVFERFVRAHGTFGQPNPFAGYVTVGAMVAAGLLLGLAVTRARSLREPWAIGVAVALLLAAGAVGMSFSRGAWIAATVGACGMLVASDRRTVKYVAAAGLLLGLFGLLGAFQLLPTSVTDRLVIAFEYFGIFDARKVVLTAENFAIVERMATWQAAADMFGAYPILGVGVGNFDAFYPRFQLPGWDHKPGHAHNLVLTTLSETGIVGAGFLASFLAGQAVLVIRALVDARRPSADRLALPLALGALGAFVTVLVHNQLDSLYVQHIPLQLAMVFGLAAASSAANADVQP